MFVGDCGCVPDAVMAVDECGQERDVVGCLGSRGTTERCVQFRGCGAVDAFGLDQGVEPRACLVEGASGPRTSEDLERIVSVVGRGRVDGVQQRQRALAFPEIARKLFAVVVGGLVKVQQVVGDLKRDGKISAEPVKIPEYRLRGVGWQ